MASLPDGSVDAVVTDPPYELGFMGRQWDSTGIAFDIGLWREVLRVLKPGGHAAVFAASRTYHRLACAMEDAGFEIRDQIDWVYASGMPARVGRGHARRPGTARGHGADPPRLPDHPRRHGRERIDVERPGIHVRLFSASDRPLGGA
ncbi:MAG: DNA methyltransferase [Bifidobacterium bifidum]